MNFADRRRQKSQSTLAIFGLGPKAKRRDLRDLLLCYGDLAGLRLQRPSRGRVAFADFATAEGAQAALWACDGRRVLGYRIRCKLAFSAPWQATGATKEKPPG